MLDKLTIKLQSVLNEIDYANSEIYSASDNLPDYNANSLTKDNIGNAESYLCTALDELQIVVNALEEFNKSTADF